MSVGAVAPPVSTLPFTPPVTLPVVLALPLAGGAVLAGPSAEPPGDVEPEPSLGGGEPSEPPLAGGLEDGTGAGCGAGGAGEGGAWRSPCGRPATVVGEVATGAVGRAICASASERVGDGLASTAARAGRAGLAGAVGREAGFAVGLPETEAGRSRRVAVGRGAVWRGRACALDAWRSATSLLAAGAAGRTLPSETGATCTGRVVGASRAFGFAGAGVADAAGRA